ncbi:unnamed protein product, partial [Amoebophrya sp. A25]
ATVGRCERLGNTGYYQRLDCTGRPGPGPTNATADDDSTNLTSLLTGDNTTNGTANGTNDTTTTDSGPLATSTTTTTTTLPTSRTVFNYYDYDDRFLYHDGYCIS